MANKALPSAERALDEGARALESIDAVGLAAPVAPPPPQSVPSPPAPPAPTAILRAFEDWAQDKLPCALDMMTGRASGIVGGKRIHTKATANAAVVNAARSLHRIPLGARMTEAEFDQAISATRSIAIK